MHGDGERIFEVESDGFETTTRTTEFLVESDSGEPVRHQRVEWRLPEAPEDFASSTYREILASAMITKSVTVYSGEVKPLFQFPIGKIGNLKVGFGANQVLKPRAPDAGDKPEEQAISLCALSTSSPTSPFAPTPWTLVLRARGDSLKARLALSELCEAYYTPVFRFLRREGRTDDADIELTQEFFAGILRREDLGRVDPERGRFERRRGESYHSSKPSRNEDCKLPKQAIHSREQILFGKYER